MRLGRCIAKFFSTRRRRLYMADIMPTMEAELMKAQPKLNQSLPNQSPR